MKKIEKIMLIFPHRITLKDYKEDLTPPLGLAYIAAVLKENNYNIKILDVAAEDFENKTPLEGEYIRIGLGYEEIEKRIRDFNPDVVGTSCLFTTQFHEMRKICDLAKKIDKNIITIVGGEHPSAMPMDSLKEKSIDYVVIGEGEYTVRDLLKALNSGKDISKIDGLGFKKNGKPKINPKTKFIADLDELPMPARDLLPMQTYFKTNLPQSGTSMRSPNTPIMTSRGCSARCIFCATTKFWGNCYRARSPEKVLEELEYLKKEYGIREVQIVDDNLTLNKDRAMKIFQGMIDRKLDLTWCTPQGIALWAMDTELLDKMKEAGCYEVTFAIESGDQHVLNQIIKKPLKLEKIEPLVKHAKKIGLITKGYFVVGFPGETKEQMNKTIDYAKKLKMDAAGIFIATPLPGTELYRVCKEKGYLRDGFDFQHVNYAVGNIKTDDFTPEDVERIVSKGILSVNMGLLWRNPFKFFKKYFNLFRTNPKSLIKYVFFLRRKSKGTAN